MPRLSKLEFSRTYKISRPTLDRRIKAGYISTMLEPDGSVVIDTTEADRIGLRPRRRSGSDDRVGGASAAQLQTKLEMTEKLLAKAEAELERANQNTENWRKQLTASMAVLTDQRDKAVRQADTAQNKAQQLASEVDGLQTAKLEADYKRRAQNDKFKQLADAFADQAARMAKETADAKAELEAYKARPFFQRLFGQ